MKQETTAIRTSEDKWAERAIKAYAAKREFNLVDDADLGLSAKDVRSAVNLMAFLKKEKKLSIKEMSAILFGLGITASGVWIVLAAIADPEPTSKLTLLIAGGLILALTGSLGTLRALGIQFAVHGKAFGNEFHITPENKK